MNITIKNDWVVVANDPVELQTTKDLTNLTGIAKGKVAIKSGSITTVAVNDLVLFRAETTPMSVKFNKKSYSVVLATDIIGVLSVT